MEDNSKKRLRKSVVSFKEDEETCRPKRRSSIFCANASSIKTRSSMSKPIPQKTKTGKASIPTGRLASTANKTETFCAKPSRTSISPLPTGRPSPPVLRSSRQVPVKQKSEAEILQEKLPDIVSSILGGGKLPEAVAIELKEFDYSAATIDEYNEKRDQIRRMLGDAEFFDNKTELNLGVASIASAKIQVDNKITTRRMSKKFHDECGIQENDILYKGLNMNMNESKSAIELKCNRTASIIESVVDIQKQIQFKMKLLDKIQFKTENSPAGNNRFPMTDGPSIRTRGGQNKEREELKRKRKDEDNARRKRIKIDHEMFRTPQKKIEFNALDERKICDNYCLEVASDVRDHSNGPLRHIAPIPFNINILDDEPDI